MFLPRISILFDAVRVLLILFSEFIFGVVGVCGQSMEHGGLSYEKEASRFTSNEETFGLNPFHLADAGLQVGSVSETGSAVAMDAPPSSMVFQDNTKNEIRENLFEEEKTDEIAVGDTWKDSPEALDTAVSSPQWGNSVAGESVAIESLSGRNSSNATFGESYSSGEMKSSLSTDLLREPPQSRKGCFQKTTFEQSLSSGGGGADALGAFHTDFSAMFALPGPGGGVFLLSPLFAFDHFYETPNIPIRDNFYRIGMNVTWMKELNEFWRMMLFVSPTYSSDFQNSSGKAVRVPAGGVGIWTPTPHWQFLFGIVYTGIDDWAVLPLCGAIWQPNEDWKIEVTLPKPRLCRRFEWDSSWMKSFWLYLTGEYAGSSWAVDFGGRDDLMSCRELRLMVGIERDRPKIGELDFNVEIGFSFYRKLYFEDSPLEYEPDVGFVEKIEIKF